MVLAVHRPSHRRDVGYIEIRAAECQACRRLNRKPDDAVDDAERIETDQPAGINLDAPDISFLVDGRAMRKAAQSLEARKHASRERLAGGGVIVVRINHEAAGVGEIERAPIRTPARSIGADNLAIE